jgi:hypothetical protein
LRTIADGAGLPFWATAFAIALAFVGKFNALLAIVLNMIPPAGRRA